MPEGLRRTLRFHGWTGAAFEGQSQFIQAGEMSVIVTGKGYANDEDVASDPYYFDPDTGKIDMREQRREIRLRFTSNVQGGNYQMGKVLMSATIGDVRP
jgi:hypothetical protein